MAVSERTVRRLTTEGLLRDRHGVFVPWHAEEGRLPQVVMPAELAGILRWTSPTRFDIPDEVGERVVEESLRHTRLLRMEEEAGRAASLQKELEAVRQDRDEILRRAHSVAQQAISLLRSGRVGAARRAIKALAEL